MSSLPSEVGQKGRDCRRRRADCGGCRANINNNKPKKRGHVSSTPAIQYDVFECGKPEHAALFEKSKKNITDYIHHGLNHSAKGETDQPYRFNSMESTRAGKKEQPPSRQCHWHWRPPHKFKKSQGLLHAKQTEQQIPQVPQGSPWECFHSWRWQIPGQHNGVVIDDGLLPGKRRTSKGSWTSVKERWWWAKLSPKGDTEQCQPAHGRVQHAYVGLRGR